MDVQCERVEELTIARVSGSIEANSGSELTRVACLAEHTEDVVLDLEEVDFLDSTGLGILVGIIRGFNDSGRKIVLAAPAPVVRKTLKITGIDRVVGIMDSVVTAVESLKGTNAE